jgi:hypothetical protein
VEIDHGAPAGTIVQAVAAGTVTALTRTANGTTLVITSTGSGERIEYAHIAHLGRSARLGAVLPQGRALGRCELGVSVTYEGAAAAAQLGRAPAPRLAPLAAADRPHFGEIIAPVLERLRNLSGHEPQGLASRSLSAIP